MAFFNLRKELLHKFLSNIAYSFGNEYWVNSCLFSTVWNIVFSTLLWCFRTEKTPWSLQITELLTGIIPKLFEVSPHKGFVASISPTSTKFYKPTQKFLTQFGPQIFDFTCTTYCPLPQCIKDPVVFPRYHQPEGRMTAKNRSYQNLSNKL